MCNDCVTVYTTLQNKTRLDVLAAFQGLNDKNQLQLMYNEETVRLLQRADVPENDRVLLGKMFQHGAMPLTLESFNERTRNELPELFNKPVACTKVQDAWMSIVQTALKLGVNMYGYIHEKISNAPCVTPSLSELIYQKAGSIKT